MTVPTRAANPSRYSRYGIDYYIQGGAHFCGAMRSANIHMQVHVDTNNGRYYWSMPRPKSKENHCSSGTLGTVSVNIPTSSAITDYYFQVGGCGSSNSYQMINVTKTASPSAREWPALVRHARTHRSTRRSTHRSTHDLPPVPTPAPALLYSLPPS